MNSCRAFSLVLLVAAAVAPACRGAGGEAPGSDKTPASRLAIAAVAAEEQRLVRYVRATGTLVAEDQADVAAETGGRIVATPVERGSAVDQGAELIRLSSEETEAQLKEAEANAGQIEARLGLAAGAAFDLNNVPEVRHARAAFELSQNEFDRIRQLLDQRVVSQSEFDQRRTQTEAARQQHEAAKNAAAQQYQALQAARARVALARKAVADTTVRAPFGGLVVERLVSVGDYVTRGTKVAVVVRIDPLRVRLTVPEQSIAAVQIGQAVVFEVDAYPGRDWQGRVRYVSPALDSDRRALVVEAVVPNPGGALKPGLFATARLEQVKPSPGVVVPAAAVQTTGGTSRVFVVSGDHVEERVVTVGERVNAMIELTTGLKPGERVATSRVAELKDGTLVTPQSATPNP